MKRKTISNSAKCEGCIYCELLKDNKIENVYCTDRNRKWIFGQHIEPCNNYKKKDNT